MPQHDERDHLAALDFSGVDESYDDGSEEFDALDFSAADDDGSEEAAIDALDEYAPAEPEEAGTELDAIDAQADAVEGGKADEEDGLQQLFTVTNPPDTVSVSALIDGRTQRIELSAKVTSMSEAELADEILVLADLARLKGLAAQHTYLLESASDPESMREMGEMGADTFEALRDFMENGMKLSTPEQAAAAQAEVFATRYATDK